MQNLKSRVQKQQDFEEELAVNEIMLNNLEKTGQEMIEDGHYASEAVAARLSEVANLWKELLEATAQKGKAEVLIYNFINLRFLSPSSCHLVNCLQGDPICLLPCVIWSPTFKIQSKYNILCT